MWCIFVLGINNKDMKNTINCCLYTRVSTAPQEFGRQIRDLKNYCKAFNISILDTFSEKLSGKQKTRPALTELLNYCEENKDRVNFVIISELSRLGRTEEVLNTVRTLNTLQIGLISLKESIKTLNDDRSVNHTTGMLIGILSSINAYEIETTKYRSISGLQNAAQKGHWLGGKMLPFGYMRKEKMLVINDDEAKIIRQIFEMYINGKGCVQIATYLNGQGVATRTGVRWRDKVIYDIIRNELYIGKRVMYKVGTFSRSLKKKYDDPSKEINMTSPAIIDEQIYNKANSIRTNKTKVNQSKIKYDYLLNEQLLRCGVCGKSYFAHKRANGNDNAYKCISIRYQDNCGNYAISIPKLEYAVKFVFMKDLLKLLKIDDSQQDNLQKELRSYESEYKTNEKQLSRLIDLYTIGLIKNKTDFISKQQAIIKKQNQISQLITSTKEKLQRIESTALINVDAWFRNKTAWTSDATSQRVERMDITKEHIRQVIKNITITKDSKVICSVKGDRTVKVDITSIVGNTITLYLSQRSKHFVYENQNCPY